MTRIRNPFIRIVSIMLAIVMLISIAPLNVFAVDNVTETTSVEENEAFTKALPAEIFEEDISLRDESTKHFRLSDGRMQAVTYATPVHYQDSNGNWRNIDNTLKENTSDSNKSYTATNGATSVNLPESFNNGKATLNHNGYSVAFSLSAKNKGSKLDKIAALKDVDKLASNEIQENANRKAALIEDGVSKANLDEKVSKEIKAEQKAADKAAKNAEKLDKYEAKKAEIIEKNDEKTTLENLSSAVEYKDVLPSTDVEYIATPTGLKENLIINTPPENIVYEEVEIEENSKEILEPSESKTVTESDKIETSDLSTNASEAETGAESEEVLPQTKGYIYYTFDMDFGKLIPVSQDNGSIILRTAKGKKGKDVFIIDAPYLYDSLGVYCSAEQTLEKVDGNWRLTVKVDAEWMNDEVRVYPVVLDPTIEYKFNEEDENKINDTYVSNYSEEILGITVSPFKSAAVNSLLNYMTIGYRADRDSCARSYIQLTLPTLPANTIIVNSTIEYQWQKTHGSSFQVNLYEVPYSLRNRTLTWDDQPFGSTKNSHSNLPVLDAQIIDGRSEYVFELTGLLRREYSDKRNSTYIMLASSNEGGSVDRFVDFYTVNNSSASRRPEFIITYEYPGGLEDDFFSNEEFDVGRAGTIYIGDYYRDINILRDELSLGDVEISRVYYQNWADEGISGTLKKDNAFPYGEKWKLNYSQSLTKSADKYIYINHKGQRITFEYSSESDTRQCWEISDQTLTEEEYTLWVPSDNAPLDNIVLESDEGFSKFYSNGYLKEIKETEDATQAITISYESNSPRISEIKDTSNRKLEFKYTNNKLSSIAAKTETGTAIKMDATENPNDGTPYTYTYSYSGNNLAGVSYPDGENVSYNFNDSQVKLTDVDGYNIRIERSNNFVTQVQEYTGNTVGNWLKINKDDFYQCTLTDNLGNRNIKQFDDMGQTICVIDKDGNYVAETYDNIDKETGKKQRGVLLTESGSDITSISLLKNHSAEYDSSWTSYSYGDSPSTYSMNDTAQSYAGEKSFKITNPTAFTANGGGRIRQALTLSNLKPGKTYTISGYINTAGLTKCENNPNESWGAAVMLSTYGTPNYQPISTYIQENTEGWAFVSATLTLPDSYTYTSAYAELLLRNCTGTAYFDAIQLEEGEWVGEYNYVEDADFNSIASTSSVTSTTFTDNFETKVNLANLGQELMSHSGTAPNSMSSSTSLVKASADYKFLGVTNKYVAMRYKGSKSAVESYLTSKFPNWSKYNVNASLNVQVNLDNSAASVSGVNRLKTAMEGNPFTISFTRGNGSISNGAHQVKLDNMYSWNQSQTPANLLLQVDAMRDIATQTGYRSTNYVPNNGTSYVNFKGSVTYPATAIQKQENNDNVRHSKLNDSALRLAGRLTENVNATVKVPVGAKAGDSYLVGVWAKPEKALPIPEIDNSGRSFGFTVKNAAGETIGEQDNFNPNNPNWQYLQMVVDVPEDTNNLNVELNFNKQLGTVFFDGLQVQLEDRNPPVTDSDNGTTQPTDPEPTPPPSRKWSQSKQDSQGNTNASRTTDGFASLYEFNQYDSRGNETKSIDSIGNTVEYVYDSDTDLLKSVSTGGNEFVENNGINLLENSSFEDAHFDEVNNDYVENPNRAENWLHWSMTGSDYTITRTADAVRTGEFGYKLQRTTSSAAFIEQIYGGVVPGEKYTLSGWFKVPSGTINGTGAGLSIEVLDANQEKITTIEALSNRKMSGDWEQLSATITLPEDGRYLRIKARLDGIGTVYVDDLMLEAVLVEHDAPETATTNPVNYAYNAMGELAKVEQIVNDLSNGTQIENSYEYQHGRLKSITHNGMTYNFEYDAWGNQTKAKVGAQDLISYGYSSDGYRNLNTITYANNDTISYEYDNKLGVITKIYLNSVKSFEYGYNSNGELKSVTDNVAGIVTTYTDDGVEVNYSGTVNYSKKGDKEYFRGQNFVNSSSSATDEATGSTTDTQTVFSDTHEHNYITVSDYFGRKQSQSVKINGATTPLRTEFAYTDIGAGRTSSQVESLTNKINGKSAGKYSYSYDTKGNITEIKLDGSVVASYTYDEAGQLTGENGTQFVYDKGGNIVQKGGDSFTYGNPNWKDQLTAVNGVPITYDALGNPLNYLGNTLTWNGRQLASYNGNTYKYDIDGLRTQKTVNGVLTKYIWNEGTLVGQYDSGTSTSMFFYYVDGEVVGFRYNGSRYFFLKNLQGDVVKVTNTSGGVVAEYIYDAWGKVLTATGSMAEVNPIRYRGYYYDKETQLYYVNSRYYNPQLGRFLNFDEVQILFYTLGKVHGGNGFAYCGNDPIKYFDPYGYERLVVSGGYYSSNASYKYSFIDSALFEILSYSKSKRKNTTLLVMNVGLTKKDKDKLKELKKKYSFKLGYINNITELNNYINKKIYNGKINGKKITNKNNNGRTKDKITQFRMFSHGYSGSIPFGHGYYSNDSKEWNKLTWTITQVKKLNKNAFKKTNSIFYSCNTGTKVNGKPSFAQEWSNRTGGKTKAVVDGKTDYSYINALHWYEYLEKGCDHKSCWYTGYCYRSANERKAIYKANRDKVGGYSVPYPSWRLPEKASGKWNTFEPIT